LKLELVKIFTNIITVPVKQIPIVQIAVLLELLFVLKAFVTLNVTQQAIVILAIMKIVYNLVDR
jgi:hypothetical protein